MNRLFSLMVFGFLLLCPFATRADYQTKHVTLGERVVWIDPRGSDVFGNGTLAHPFATPAYATKQIGPGGIVLVNDGVYSVFGRLETSGTEEAPITIRPAPDAHPIFSLIDVNDGIQLAASHLIIEGLEITQSQLEQPGSCLSLRQDVSDIELTSLDVHGCGRGLAVGAWAFSWGKLDDITFSDLSGPAISCEQGACIDQEWSRLKIEQIQLASSSTAAVMIGERGGRILLERSTVQAVEGMGLEADIPSIGISNSVFSGISGVAVNFLRGGTLSYSVVDAASTGVAVTMKADAFLRGNLLTTSQQSAEALHVFGSPAVSSTLTVEKNRIEIPQNTWTLLPREGKQSLSIWRNAFFFAEPTTTVRILGQSFSLDQFADASGTRFENGGEQEVDIGELPEDARFSPVINGGRVEIGDPESIEDSRIIYAGTPLKSKTETLFLFAQDAHIHWVPRRDVLDTWLPPGSPVEEVPTATLDTIARGEPLSYRPRTVLLRAEGDTALYAVTDLEQTQLLMDEAIARETYGPRWEKKVRTLSAQEWEQYRREQPLYAADDVPSIDKRAREVDPSDLF